MFACLLERREGDLCQCPARACGQLDRVHSPGERESLESSRPCIIPCPCPNHIYLECNERLASDGLCAEVQTCDPQVRCGVGITFETMALDGSARVKSLVRGGGADNTGLIKQGDILFEVGRTNVFREPLDLVADLLLGDDGSSVRLRSAPPPTTLPPAIRIFLWLPGLDWSSHSHPPLLLCKEGLFGSPATCGRFLTLKYRQLLFLRATF